MATCPLNEAIFAEREEKKLDRWLAVTSSGRPPPSPCGGAASMRRMSSAATSALYTGVVFCRDARGGGEEAEDAHSRGALGLPTRLTQRW